MSIALPRTTLVAFTVFAATLLVSGASLKAMPIFFDLELTATAGPDAGTIGSGSFSIDGHLMTGTGTEVFTPASGLLNFDVSFAGVTFDSMNDALFPNKPIVTLESNLVTDIIFSNGPSAPIASFLIADGFNFAFSRFGELGITEGFATVS